MKSSTKNMTLAIAALVMAAGTVSAQTMKAEIPFAFRVGERVMQPGEYVVRVVPALAGTSVFTLAGIDAGHAVFLAPSSHDTPSKEWTSDGRPKLRFECGEGPCRLVRMWAGEGDTYYFHSKRGKDGEMRVAEITLRAVRAD